MAYHDDFDDYDPTTEPIYRRLNPCDIARYRIIAPIGDAVAKLATDCNCCNGFRILIALGVGVLAGSFLG